MAVDYDRWIQRTPEEYFGWPDPCTDCDCDGPQEPTRDEETEEPCPCTCHATPEPPDDDAMYDAMIDRQRTDDVRDKESD